MNADPLRLALALMLAATPAVAQGFAGLGSSAGDYAAVTAPARLAFPRDDGPHPEFRIEWWYLTANLRDAEGTDYGVQWTLFRQAIAPGPDTADWTSNQVWLGHAALTEPDRHRFAETLARGGIGQAGVTASPFHAWIDAWDMRGPFDDLAVTARGADFGFTLRAATQAPPVPQGRDGYSVKSAAGQASYYFSRPSLAVAGTLDLGDRQVPVSGTAWLDREWSSQPLAADQAGWDWFSLALDDGSRVMAFRLRDRDGGAFVSGTWIAPDGTPAPLSSDAIRLTPRREASVAGRRLPIAWRVEIPARGLAVDTEPVNAQSWMGTGFPYWEGPVRLTGSHTGRGYLEMTGYE